VDCTIKYHPDLDQLDYDHLIVTPKEILVPWVDGLNLNYVGWDDMLLKFIRGEKGKMATATDGVM
jgi:hypothetical protein